jgi:hypothetical protein
MGNMIHISNAAVTMPEVEYVRLTTLCQDILFFLPEIPEERLSAFVANVWRDGWSDSFINHQLTMYKEGIRDVRIHDTTTILPMYI